MKIETLWELLQDERYACLTVSEFVETIKDSRVMEVEPFKPTPGFEEWSIRLHERTRLHEEEKAYMKKDEDISFLAEPEWKPETVVHYTSKETK